MKKYIIIGLVVCSYQLAAQNISDAVRYSFLPQLTTARSIGVGGSMSPVGADISVASNNPAGIAEYRKSEFVIGFGIPTNSADAEFAGITETENKTRFQVNSLGMVFAYRPDNPKLRTMNLSIGINKMADFTQNIFYGGSTPGTRTERFLEVSNLRTLDELDDFEGGLAFDTELIFDTNADNIYESDFFTFNEVLYKEEFIERSGSLKELFVNLAANYDNKLSFGLTLGIPILNYTETKTYLEADDVFGVDNFLDFIYTQSLSTTGGGINLKGGVIYKATPKVRISAAIHSPSWYFLTDEFDTSLDFRLDGEETGLLAESPISEFDYRLRTPWRALAGIGLIYSLGDIKGFLSGEVEYVDYSGSSFDITVNSNDPVDQFFEEDLNNELTNNLTSGLNYRIGTELALSKFRIRVGGGMFQSPYVNSNLLDIDLQLNGGIGYRGNRFYVDLSYNTRNQSEQYTPYRLLDTSNNQTVAINNTISQIGLTVGFKM